MGGLNPSGGSHLAEVRGAGELTRRSRIPRGILVEVLEAEAAGGAWVDSDEWVGLKRPNQSDSSDQNSVKIM